MSIYNYFAHNEHSGEQKLFAAVLNQVILDALDTRYVIEKIRNKKTKKLQEIKVLNPHCANARKWVLNKSKGFDFYCDHLGLLPESVREFFVKLFSRYPIDEHQEIIKLNKKLNNRKVKNNGKEKYQK